MKYLYYPYEQKGKNACSKDVHLRKLRFFPVQKNPQHKQHIH